MPNPVAPTLFAPGEWEGKALVMTEYGALAGGTDSEATFSWLGIPYASPPVGDRRWQAPAPPQPWMGLRQARRYGSKATQRSFVTGMATGSEDCLYLNIWRPASAARNLPVYLWIHGGANRMGSSNSMPEYLGYSLASKGNLVFVSINYRLDIFGWFSHPALRCGDPDSDSGNFGTLDLIAGLDWLRRNVSAFGGDPGNVTVAGESAGAFNILTLLIAPKAKGLFHKAVVESGYTRALKVEPEAYALDLERRLAIRRGKAANEAEAEAWLASLPKEERTKWLKSAEASDLIRLSNAPIENLLTLPCPVLDGQVLPSDGFAALADPLRRADVPLIIGTNKEETKLFLTLWRQNSNEPRYQELAEVSSSLWKAEGADAVADALGTRSGGVHTYLYRFDWGAPDQKGRSVLGGRMGTRLGAAHGIEIPFFLQTDAVYANLLPFLIFTKANEKGRRELQARMGSYLLSFIRTGNPNEKTGNAEASLPVWPAWDASVAEPSFIVFDASPKEARIRIESGRSERKAILKQIENDAPPALKENLLKLKPMLE